MTPPKTPKPKRCTLCDRTDHRAPQCPYRKSPTPLLSALMQGLDK